ncbi:MAG: aryl-sulfate sulfotransferase [Eubacteriales bacterium]|nr:aryl-sulfate sulfotransferase [Eubacteriales bacterium]
MSKRKRWRFRFAAAALCLGGSLMLPLVTPFCGAGYAFASQASGLVYEVSGWQVSLEDARRAAELSTVSVALGYSSVETKNLEKQASDGMEFCMLKLAFSKMDSTESIEWEKVQLVDSLGNGYSRMDDGFLTDYGMSRLPGTDLNFGSYEGWICFEVPAEAEGLKLVYPFAVERLVIEVEAESPSMADTAETGRDGSEAGNPDGDTEDSTPGSDSAGTAGEATESGTPDSDDAGTAGEATESGTPGTDSAGTGTDATDGSREDAATESESGSANGTADTAAPDSSDASDTPDSLSVSQPESESETAQETQPNTWTRLESYDYFTSQRTIDYNLYQESQKGYSFQDPLVIVDPYQNSPLSAMVIFTTPDETSVDAVIKGKDAKNDITVTFPAATTHILPIYGLYAGDTTQVELMLDTREYVELEITTEKIDTLLSTAEVTVAEEDALDDGMLTFVCVQTADGGSYGAAAYDNAGDLRWLLETPESTVLPLKRLKNGRMMMSSSRLLSGTYYMSGLVEFDLCGKYYKDYLIPGGEHHDFVELENGNLLVCSSAEDFSSVEDRIVEIDRETGEVVYELNIADLIEPSDGGSLNRTDADWCHNNSLDYDEATDTLMLSCRHLDAVLGIGKTKKELKWVLGDPTGFTSVSAEKFFTPIETEDGFEWQYAQHNATFLPNGDILLFDNGTHRTKLGLEDQAVTGENVYSRAVQYHIDTENMTVQQVWSYGKERGAKWYSSFISGASYLSEDNYWITSGGIGYDAELDSYDLTVAQVTAGEHHTYLDQVKDGELVYELFLPILTYRSIRMSLYPEEDTYSVYERGKYLGNLGTVPQFAETEETEASEAASAMQTDDMASTETASAMQTDDMASTRAASATSTDDASADAAPSALSVSGVQFLASDAQELTFPLTTLLQMPDRILLSGTWPETASDASLVLLDEHNTAYRFKISPPSYQTGDSAAFSVWITPQSLPYSHRYRIYLYNQGTLYTTWRFFDNYVDTSDSLDGRGPQKTLYDLDGRSYTLMTSEELEITTDLTTELSLPAQTQAATEQILAELENNAYTFENPLVIQNPYQITPLTALIAFQTEDACQVRITVKGKTASQDLTDTLDAAASHLVPVLGLYADYDNQVLLELLDDSGAVTQSRTLTITTEKLPEYLRTAVQTGSYTADSAMDLMLISGLSTPYLYAFDELGDIRWYCTLEREYYGAFPLENGHILTESPGVLYPNASMPNSPEFLEMDYLGRVYQIYYFPEGVHHEIKEMTPGGNFLIATNSNDCYEQNLIQEIDRETGAVVKSLSLNDVFEGLEYIDRDDWCHINTLSYDEATNTILVSSRNLHSVIRIDWTTDEIVWILGDPLLWESTAYADKVLQPDADFQWHYQQHTAYTLLEDLDGNPETVEIMLFDNHNAQYRMLDDFQYTGSSYVKIYSVNAADMTVSQLQNYETAYSSITSNSFYIGAEERVFSVNAYISSQENYNGRIYEFDYQTGKQVNTWLISHKFYRGYNVSLSMKDCAEPFSLAENYRKGVLRTPVAVENPVGISGAGTLTEQSVSFVIQENVLYMQGGDHMYTQIIFNGENGTYAYDISDIKLISGNVNSYQYRLPIPLAELPPDSYTVQIMYMDRLYNTSAAFTIS